MGLKFKLTATEHSLLPPLVQAHYKVQGSDYVLDLEGIDTNAQARVADLETRLGEFRTTNVELMRLRDTLQADLKKFDGVDPTKHAELQARVKELEKQGVAKPDDIHTIVANAVKQAVEPLQLQVTTLTASEKAAQDRLKDNAFSTALTQAAVKAGVVESAIPDVVARARATGFKADETGAVTKATNAQSLPVYYEGQELTVDLWLRKQLPSEAAHLFKPTAGGGATPGAGGGAPLPAGVVANDALEIGRNAEKIARGEVTVAVPA
jgi:hypothetical protein